MPRGRAEPILAGLLRRVEEVNATPHYLFRIPTVIVYGSYVRGEALLGDVDIAVDLEPKWERASKEFEVQSKKRVNVAQAKEGGSQISSSICTGRSARSCSI
jgi:predicted nucleotidyltransferase